MSTRRLIASILFLGVISVALARPVHAASYTASAVAFSFFDISATGTLLPTASSSDDTFESVALPFTFRFYDTDYVSMFVASNGLLTFGSGNSTFTNADLTADPPQAAIAPYWDDLHPGLAGDVLVETVGAPGSQQFIVQWNGVAYFAGSASITVTFQAVLFEGSNDILFSYLDLDNHRSSATVGIKDAGPQGPDRLLLNFNAGPNAFVGTGQSTLIQQVPEPATLLLVGAGLAGFAARRRARRA
jgi:hypothetical protein